MSSAPLKLCKDCGLVRPQSDFYCHPRMADGFLNSCKFCRQAYEKRRRLTNPAVRARDKTPARRKQRQAIAARWRQANPNGHHAHNAANNAVRDGKLIREPCQLCGVTEFVHKHHGDYSRPLDIIWLCARCHQRLHAIFPELRGKSP